MNRAGKKIVNRKSFRYTVTEHPNYQRKIIEKFKYSGFKANQSLETNKI